MEERLCQECNRPFYPKEELVFEMGHWVDKTATICEDCILNKEFPDEETKELNDEDEL